MPEIRPFRAIQYVPEKVGSLSDVLTPPYDVITPEAQEEFYRKHPYNFIRLDLARKGGQGEALGRYATAAQTLKDWLEDGILAKTPVPAVYVYDQSYTWNGMRLTRRAFVALVEVADYAEEKVLPHEFTHSGPKKDRFELIKATGALFSQVFGLYDDDDGFVHELLEQAKTPAPLFEVQEPDGVTSAVWSVEDFDTIRKLLDFMRARPVYIADGHHRYETALNIQKYARENLPSLRGADYVAMACVSMSDPGLSLLPTHRAVQLPAETSFNSAMGRLRQYFTVRKVDSYQQVEEFLSQVVTNKRFGMYWQGQGFYLLELPDGQSYPQSMAEAFSDRWYQLDVSILHCCILKDCLRVPEADLFEKGPVFFSHSHELCMERAREGDHRVVFFVQPTTLQDMKDIVLQGEKMPPKSTFFYPKLISGLLTYDLHDSPVTL